MAKTDSKRNEEDAAVGVCGVIMPISASSGYDANHWSDVKDVIFRAAKVAGMKPQLVSDSIDSDIIQKRIVSNLYDNEVVVCDVSSLNPNVMFELGMRLAFQKPTIVITDDIGSLPFDTKIIEHLPYPPSLHYQQIEIFITKLADRIKTLNDKNAVGKYKSFIDAFGPFEVVAPRKENVSFESFVMEQLSDLASAVNKINRNPRPGPPRTSAITVNQSEYTREYTVANSEVSPQVLIDRILASSDVSQIRVGRMSANSASIQIELFPWAPSGAWSRIEQTIKEYDPDPIPF